MIDSDGHGHILLIEFCKWIENAEKANKTQIGADLEQGDELEITEKLESRGKKIRKGARASSKQMGHIEEETGSNIGIEQEMGHVEQETHSQVVEI